MAIRQFKPVTKSSRFRSVSDFAEITRSTPEKSLVEPLPKSGGRDNHGHIAMRRIGGGHKRQYRVIDFKRNKFAMPAIVRAHRVRSEPLGAHRAGALRGRREALHPASRRDCRVGDTVIAGPGSDTRIGNALPLREMPLGTDVHNIELKPGKGGQMARSAGMSAQVVAKEGEYVTLQLGSTEVRLVHGMCMATVGIVGNAEHELLSHGKAGKSRWLGKRPKVRGEVMNPVDHPHGGRTRGGRNVVSPWGKKEGVKTRHSKKPSTAANRARPSPR